MNILWKPEVDAFRSFLAVPSSPPPPLRRRAHFRTKRPRFVIVLPLCSPLRLRLFLFLARLSETTPPGATRRIFRVTPPLFIRISTSPRSRTLAIAVTSVGDFIFPPRDFYSLARTISRAGFCSSPVSREFAQIRSETAICRSD